MRLAIPLDEVLIADEASARLVAAICASRTSEGTVLLSKRKQTTLLQTAVFVGAIRRRERGLCCEQYLPAGFAASSQGIGFKEARLATIIRHLLHQIAQEHGADDNCTDESSKLQSGNGITVGVLLRNHKLWCGYMSTGGEKDVYGYEWTLVSVITVSKEASFRQFDDDEGPNQPQDCPDVVTYKWSRVCSCCCSFNICDTCSVCEDCSFCSCCPNNNRTAYSHNILDPCLPRRRRAVDLMLLNQFSFKASGLDYASTNYWDGRHRQDV